MGMSNFIAVISLIGDWLLLSFPLYQGLMELKEFKALLEEFEQVSKRWRPISPWWWLIPPLKVHKERVRGNKSSGWLPIPSESAARPSTS